MGSLDRPLAVGALVHALLAVAMLCWLFLPAESILGVHPGLKPFKFGISIALFLGTLAVVLPLLTVDAATRMALSSVLLVTMVLEMVPILVQALRGTTSHFNVDGAFNTLLWRLMQGSIVVAVVALLVLGWLMSSRPLLTDGFMTFAWRAGLWISIFGAASGFSMGGTGAHSVGGVDGGPGLPLVNWSTRHGDLRLAHFIALHALQSVPLVAWAVSRALPEGLLRWVLLMAFVVLQALLALASFTRALSGRTLW